MKIILNQDVVNLGEEGDVVVVKDGYARNYLLPNNIAVRFNRTNEAIFASRSAAIEKRKVEKRAESATLKQKIEKVVLTMVVSAGDSGKLFGSVTSSMVQEALAKQGIEVERKKIEVASHAIKMVGTYSVRIRLYEDESAEIKLIVESEAQVKARKAEEAKAAAEAARAAAKVEAAAAAEAAAALAKEVTEEPAADNE